MIDEKKLIEVLERNFGGIGGASVLKQLIEAQPKVGEWIPVEEALPKELQRVLVQKITGTIEVLRYYGEKDKWGGDSYHNVHPRLIKAWQPLPKAYEG